MSSPTNYWLPPFVLFVIPCFSSLLFLATAAVDFLYTYASKLVLSSAPESTHWRLFGRVAVQQLSIFVGALSENCLSCCPARARGRAGGLSRLLLLPPPPPIGQHDLKPFAQLLSSKEALQLSMKHFETKWWRADSIFPCSNWEMGEFSFPLV